MRIQVVRTKQNEDWIMSLIESCFDKQIPVQMVGMMLCFDIEDYDGLFKVWFHALSEYSKWHTWSDTCLQRYFRVADTSRSFWIRPVDCKDGMIYYNAGEKA